jgi:hypothetical protein
MAGVLKFEAREVARVIAAAKKAKEHHLSYEELWDESMHLGGVLKLDAGGQPDLSNIDPAKRRPRLWLVKDRGVYLMSNAVVPEGRRAAVTYADGLSPGDEYYDMARSIMGGDDCVIPLPLNDFEDLLEHGAVVIRVRVTEESVQIAAEVPANKKTRPIR